MITMKLGIPLESDFLIRIYLHKMVQLVWKIVWQLFKKLNRVTILPAILLIGIQPKEERTRINPKTCTWRFKAALFTIAKKQNNLTWAGEHTIKSRWYSIESYP